MVRTVGLEPTRPIGHKILSLERLPFRQARSRCLYRINSMKI